MLPYNPSRCGYLILKRKLILFLVIGMNVIAKTGFTKYIDITRNIKYNVQNNILILLKFIDLTIFTYCNKISDFYLKCHI